MGHFKLFILKYTKNEYLYFTILHNKYDTIYSSHLIFTNTNIINEFKNKYTLFSMEITDSY